jgi:hypothetical protein
MGRDESASTIVAGVDSRPDKAPARFARLKQLENDLMRGRPFSPAPPPSEEEADDVYVPLAEEISQARSAEVDAAERPAPKGEPTFSDIMSSLVKACKGKQVVFGCNGMKFKFQALAVSVSRYAIALVTDEGTSVEPDIGTEVDLTIDGRMHKTIYAGGFFSFAEAGYNLICFMSHKDDGKERGK